MDYFSVFFNCFSVTIQSLLHLAFISRMFGKKYKIRYFILYPLTLFILGFVATRNSIISTIAIGVQLLTLCMLNCTALKVRYSVSFLATTLAIYISQLSFGIVNSIEAITFPHFVGMPLLYLLLIFATIVAFGICVFCYAAVLKNLSFQGNVQIPHINLLLLPGLFFFLAELYILHMSYSRLPAILTLAEMGTHIGLLLIQVLGLIALLCTLYAYRRICYGFQAQSALTVLTQAAQAQRTYISEAQMRYEQTKAFRHDMKNHLLVLDGLLSKGLIEESRSYLLKLKTASSSLFFSCHTGNPVVDILLGEKMGIAQGSGIHVEVSLIFPPSCGIDSFDLCIIFANALDNAMNACQSFDGEKIICINGQRQGDFYMLEFRNSCTPGNSAEIGTGLSNIKTVAEKYHGAMLIEKENGNFCLNVLLNISLQSDNSSQQTH